MQTGYVLNRPGVEIHIAQDRDMTSSRQGHSRLFHNPALGLALHSDLILLTEPR